MPEAAAPAVNRIGLPKDKYDGEPSTLCVGCGHDSISRSISDAYYEMGIQPWTVGKVSGIGCSSKTPAYFIAPGFGLNTTHGRMPAFATGAGLANKNISLIGVSGDGDTMSIGIGQFLHLCRRNINIVYIIENNGTYGLTKGQFSATADLGSPSKRGSKNEFVAMDPCLMAIAAGATFVARSFSGDRKQLVPLLKAAIAHRGAAVIDVISPCVTFNNHAESTKSFTYIREHNDLLQEIGFVPSFAETTVDYDPGTTTQVELPDGSTIYLKKLKHDFDVSSKERASHAIMEASSSGQVLTGLFYVDTKMHDLHGTLNLVDPPLAHLQEKDLKPNRETFDKLLKPYF